MKLPVKALLAASALFAVAAWWISGTGVLARVEIPAGSSASQVAELLRQQGVIACPPCFRALAKLSRLDRDIRPGSYRMRRGLSSPLALWRLAFGRSELVRVVIPEGFSARQIAERLGASGVADPEEFLDYARRNRLEGYLFPTTYHFRPGMSAEDAAHAMHQEFLRVVEPEMRRRPGGRLSPDQVVILASIVEREAVLAREKPMIAAVYLNRLARRKPLEADPTVQYALGYWKRRLTTRDLRTDSPYNTYANFGLPPGPICSPGLDSVLAVLSPAQTDALYFVADNTGGHTFNRSYEEHLKAKEKARLERRQRRLQDSRLGRPAPSPGPEG